MSDRDLTRRSLLMAGGAGFLAAALPTVGLSPAAAATTQPAPATPLAPPDKQPPHLDVPQHPHQKLRWAIVGLGELALAEVLPAFAQSEHARVTALVSGHPDKVRKVADYYGVDPVTGKYIYDISTANYTGANGVYSPKAIPTYANSGDDLAQRWSVLLTLKYKF